MGKWRWLVVALLLVGAWPSMALAEPGRFTIVAADDRAFLLDTETGQAWLWVYTDTGAGWVPTRRFDTVDAARAALRPTAPAIAPSQFDPLEAARQILREREQAKQDSVPDSTGK